jgi:hypothetical protein
MGRPCSVCSDPVKLRRAAELIAQNVSDPEVARIIGVTRPALDRHRRNHVLKPAAALAQVAAKGRDVTNQRETAVKRAERGDRIAASLALDNLIGDALDIKDDLRDARKATKGAGQYSQMVGVVGQEHKNLDFFAKAGGHRGFVPEKGQPAEPARFNLTIHMGGKTEQITTVVEGPTAHLSGDIPTIDMTPWEPDDGGEQIDDAILDDIVARAHPIDKPLPADAEDTEELEQPPTRSRHRGSRK